MLYLDLDQNTEMAVSVAPVVGGTTTGDVDGDSVDLQGYTGVTFVGVVGAEGDTYGATVYHEFQVEESDDDSTFTDVADADLSTTVTSTSTNTGVFGLVNANGEAPGVFKTTYIGNCRYVRGVTLAGGTHSNGTPIAIVAILHGAQNLPIS